MQNHPLLGLWLVQAPEPGDKSSFLPLVGQSDQELFVLAFRDLPRAKAAASKLEVQDARFQFVCGANLRTFEDQLRALGVVGVTVDWDPEQTVLGDTRRLDYAA
jgi:hypothetical protein